MKITNENQTVTVEVSETEFVHFYERFEEGSKQLALVNGEVMGNAFRYAGLGLNVIKSGKGKFKKEEAFYNKLQEIFEFVKSEGYHLRSNG